jgi:ketosteroid isomerase-like protein
MKSLVLASCILATMAAPPSLPAQEDSSQAGRLYGELARMDSLLFEAAFVSCDTLRVYSILAEDVEFYHDQNGFESGDKVRDTFKRLAGNCPRERGIRRELVSGSLEVYPMKNYGAVQVGIHRFIERGATTSTVARFIHLWRAAADGTWRLARVLSFDHRTGE